MDIPFLFDANRLFEKDLPVFKTQAFINCGRSLSAYRRFNSIPEDVRDVLNSSSEEFRRAWENEFAAEALLAELAADGHGKFFPFHEVKLKSRPCGAKGPDYEGLKGKSHSLALFPISDEISHETLPSVGRIWIFVDGSSAIPCAVTLEGFDCFSMNLKKHHRVYADYTCSGVVPKGRSWELGGALALSFVEEPSVSFDLATYWLATGTVEEGQIRRIGLHNKLSLENDGRLWLLPRPNKEEADTLLGKVSIEYAINLDGAKILIRGSPRFKKNSGKPENEESDFFNHIVKSTNLAKEESAVENKPITKSDKGAEESPSSMEQTDSKLVIRMTARRPLRIVESKWPVIMKANYVTNADEFDEYPDTDTYTVFVRAQMKYHLVSYIIHGKHVHQYTRMGEESTEYAGEYLKGVLLEEGEHRSTMLLDGIRNIAKTFNLGGQRLIGDLMFSQEPFDLD